MTAPVALTIAGSDPCGGAGIQRDLRTFESLGVFGISAISAITVQNTMSVYGVYPVDPEVLSHQITYVLKEIDVNAVKIGMLGDAPQVDAVASALKATKAKNIVLDTPIISSSGNTLLSAAGTELLMNALMPLATVITPNIPELLCLSNNDVKPSELSPSILERMVQTLFDRGAKNILIKGGHLDGLPIDILFTDNGDKYEFAGMRVASPYTHGTGCILSSAIAAYLAKGFDLYSSIAHAKSYCFECISNPQQFSTGSGLPGTIDRTNE